jgi:hypothetical protein
MHGTEIGYVGHPAEFLGRDPANRREHGRHRIIDPDVRWSKALVDQIRCPKDLAGIGDVRGRDNCSSAETLNLAGDLAQGLGVAGDEAKSRPCAGEPMGDRTPDTR